MAAESLLLNCLQGLMQLMQVLLNVWQTGSYLTGYGPISCSTISIHYTLNKAWSRLEDHIQQTQFYIGNFLNLNQYWQWLAQHTHTRMHMKNFLNVYQYWQYHPSLIGVHLSHTFISWTFVILWSTHTHTHTLTYDELS